MTEKRGTVYIAPSARNVPAGRMVDPESSLFSVSWQDEVKGEVVGDEEIVGADAAIAWARERADVVLIRLGHTRDTYFSAGEHRAYAATMPIWPPRDPPSEGWYRPRPDDMADPEPMDHSNAGDEVAWVATLAASEDADRRHDV